MHKNLRVSIVIPVYNEAACMAACLEAIEAQTVRPYEVIVVDNNSSDDTVAVAGRYPCVRLLSEPRQGVVYARDRGFNAARGAIIGRIDADTVIRGDWVETVQRLFADSSLGAVTGSARYYDMALSPLLNTIDLLIRRYLAAMLGRQVALQGANMAIRRSVWKSVRRGLCRTRGMHEDFDIAIHAARDGYDVRFDASMVVSLGFRQSEACFRDFASYVLLSPRTYALHGLRSRGYMYPVVWLAILFYLPLKLLHRGYDAQTERFSLQHLMQSEAMRRVNPATFVD